ncbi:MAG TPA: O-antigen ligase family protein [Bacteroidales bacterium]|nr:O-antigen ligase family protein [Bacteroidales bacterium]
MKQILDKIELFLLCFTVFAIPVHIKVTSVAIALLLLVAFLKKENYKEFAKLYKNPAFIILIIPYLMFFLGMLNTRHVTDGVIQLEIVTSLLVFPIIFTAYKSNSLKYRAELIQSFFILGVIMAYFICMSVAVPAYVNKGNINVFLYQDFSGVIKGPHHLSYYVLFSIVILISNLIKKTPLLYLEKKLTGLKFILLVVLTIFLFQLTSKATILLYLAIVGFVFVYAVRKKLVSYKIAIPSIVLVVLISIVAFSTHKINVRFKNLFKAVEHREQVDLKSQESTALRIAAFKAGTNIVKENFWRGVGTGDIAYAMSDYYKANNFQGAYIHNISPHNQFLRSFVMHGVFGFLSVVAVFGLMIYIAVKHKNFLLMFWIFIMIVLFSTEDMFGIQDGIVFFCFYTSYFIFSPRETIIPKSEEVD